MSGLQAHETIRVADDRWGFCGATSGNRFIPFGTSSLNLDGTEEKLLGDSFDAQRIRLLLDRSAALGLNLVRVLLPIGVLMRDPQGRQREPQINQLLLDRLNHFLNLCRPLNIRAIVAFSSHGGASLAWWQRGDGCFGKNPMRSDAASSALAVHTRMVRETVSRFSTHPAIFAWSVAAEWRFPDPAWEAGVRRDDPVLRTTAGLWNWQQFAHALYGRQMDRLNRAWKTSFSHPTEITLPDFTFDHAKKQYATPQTILCDYQLFREWASQRFLRVQIDAIRRVSPKQLVTCGVPMRQWDLDAGEAQLFPGLSMPLIAPLLDFVTVHFRADLFERASQSPEQAQHHLESSCRFARSGDRKPVLIEVLEVNTSDEQASARVLESLLKSTSGHASGWLSADLLSSVPHGPGAPVDRSSWLGEGLVPTLWGQRASTVRTYLEQYATNRTPPRRTIKLEACKELTPVSRGTILSEREAYTRRPQPVDYRVEPHPALQVTLTDEERI